MSSEDIEGAYQELLVKFQEQQKQLQQLVEEKKHNVQIASPQQNVQIASPQQNVQIASPQFLETHQTPQTPQSQKGIEEQSPTQAVTSPPLSKSENQDKNASVATESKNRNDNNEAGISRELFIEEEQAGDLTMEEKYVVDFVNEKLGDDKELSSPIFQYLPLTYGNDFIGFVLKYKIYHWICFVLKKYLFLKMKKSTHKIATKLGKIVTMGLLLRS